MKHYPAITCLSVTLALFYSGLSLGADSDAPPFSAGTAKVEITPAAESAVDLFGQPLRLRDPLFARVLVLKDEKITIAIVSVDLIVFASQKVVAEAKAKWGVDHVTCRASRERSPCITPVTRWL